ncbi:NlpC/P60 family protein, partial [Pseudonocardia abyssalis]
AALIAFPTAAQEAAPAAAPAPAAVTSAAAPAPVLTTRIAPVAVSAPAAAPAAVSSARLSAVDLALSKVGSPYRWGATGPSAFDCSGLVNWAFEQAGIEVPRTSRALSQAGTAVSRGDLQPGDLVFFYSPVSHVGIYIGNGQMVHASTSGKPVAISSIDGRQYNSARRL